MKPYQYGVEEVDNQNFNRLLSAEPQLLLRESDGTHALSLPIPANQIWLIDSILFQVITDVTAVDRFVAVQVVNNFGANIWQIALAVAQTALSTVVYSFVRDSFNAFATNQFSNCRLPALPLKGGWVLNVSIPNFQPGDHVSGSEVSYRSLMLNRP
jgi:hypothetical protein